MRFVRKPVFINAIQFEEHPSKKYFGTLKSAQEIKEWSDGAAYPAHFHEEDGWCAQMTVSTLEGYMTVQPGSWVIKGIKGEYYACRPDIFAELYDPAPGDTKGPT